LVKKGFEKLDEFLPDEKVLALAVGFDPRPDMGEQRAMGAGAAFSAINASATSGRLLVLTGANLYEVRATGRLNGSRPEGIRYPLGQITDVRVRTDRRLQRLGSRERYLTFDYMRGALMETRLNEIRTDSELDTFASCLTQQVGLVAESLAAADRAARSVAPPVVVAPPVSVADELLKLAQLRDSGILTDEEFAAQKARVLSAGAPAPPPPPAQQPTRRPPSRPAPEPGPDFNRLPIIQAAQARANQQRRVETPPQAPPESAPPPDHPPPDHPFSKLPIFQAAQDRSNNQRKRK
jgi:hypothetical protein